MAGRHRRVHSSAPGRHRVPPRRGHIVLPSLAVAAVLGIGGVSAGAVLGGGDGRHPSGALGRSAPTLRVTPSPAPSASATPTATQSAVPARPAPALPDFALTVVGRVSWVSVVGPRGRVLYAGLLRHGRTLSYRQRPLAVTLGDAGAVRLVLHHRVHARAGRQGAVLRFSYR